MLRNNRWAHTRRQKHSGNAKQDQATGIDMDNGDGSKPAKCSMPDTQMQRKSLAGALRVGGGGRTLKRRLVDTSHCLGRRCLVAVT